MTAHSSDVAPGRHAASGRPLPLARGSEAASGRQRGRGRGRTLRVRTALPSRAMTLPEAVCPRAAAVSAPGGPE